MMKRRETLKIAACLTVFVLQAAAMILFSFGGCAASVHRTANSAEESPAVPSLDGEVLPGSDGFVPVQEDAAQSDGALECLYADAAREERLACAARPDAQYAQSSALLLPHYGNALGMCCDLLSSIEREAALIVLVGPNHSGTGDAIQVSGADWYWSTGRMDGDADAARTLAAAAETLTDAQIAEDWSVQTLIPYLCRYFPEARLVTVLLSRGADTQSLRALAEAVGLLAGQQELLLVGSVDFSHYLDPASARENDEKTCAWIEAGDIPAISALDNGYLDSPETAAVVLYYTQTLGQPLCRRDGLFERFWENGQEKAGSYYTFAAWQEP